MPSVNTQRCNKPDVSARRKRGRDARPRRSMLEQNSRTRTSFVRVCNKCVATGRIGQEDARNASERLEQLRGHQYNRWIRLAVQLSRDRKNKQKSTHLVNIVFRCLCRNVGHTKRRCLVVRATRGHSTGPSNVTCWHWRLVGLACGGGTRSRGGLFSATGSRGTADARFRADGCTGNLYQKNRQRTVGR